MSEWKIEHDVESFFEGFMNLFGGFAVHSHWKPLPNLPFKQYLTVSEILSGGEKEISIQRLEICEHCNTRGAEPGSPEPTPCATCEGHGEIRQTKKTFFGTKVWNVTCPQCKGHGKSLQVPCRECKGFGYFRREAHLKLQFPARVREGAVFTFEGEGDANARSGKRGDVSITVGLWKPLHVWQKKDDYFTEVRASANALKKGGMVTLDTPDGPIDMVIPPGTRSGAKIVIKGKGAPRQRGDGTRGDLQVYVKRPSLLSRIISKLIGGREVGQPTLEE